MFEHKHQPLLPRRLFVRRAFKGFGTGALLLSASLVLGMLGYRYVANLQWIDALLNASMILTGMGPVTVMTSSSSKFFASAFALFSGIVFLGTTGVMIAPWVHRFLHRFHLES